MPRAYTREPTRPDAESEQTHDDCEWLNEEDREKDVSSDRRAVNWRLSAPAVRQYERRSDWRKHDSDVKGCGGNRCNSRRVRRFRLMAFRGGAARIDLGLGENTL